MPPILHDGVGQPLSKAKIILAGKTTISTGLADRLDSTNLWCA
jgi:hypothetical protein